MSPAASAPETPEQTVDRLNAELRGKSAQEIITAAVREFGRKITYVSSFGAESAAMLGLIAEVDPGMPDEALAIDLCVRTDHPISGPMPLSPQRD